MRLFLSDFAMGLARSGYHNDAASFCEASLTALKTTLAEEQPLLAYARIYCADVAIIRNDYVAAENLLSNAVPVVIESLGDANWRSQWALALSAIAQDQTDERDTALGKLRVVLGDSSPLLDQLRDHSQRR